MDNIGNVYPSDLAMWTNPRQGKGKSGQVKFKEESINWMMEELIKRGMANEPDKTNSDYRRALRHLQKNFQDNNDKTAQFCTLTKKFMAKNSVTCKVTWQDDSEVQFKDRKKTMELQKSESIVDYCSCVVQNLNPRKWTKIAFNDRDKCIQSN